MKILSIETSCDETGISLLECSGKKNSPKFKVLGNILSSQIKIHSAYGGVYPNLAKREHIKNLPILLNKIIKCKKCKQSNFTHLKHSKKNICDIIAVTSGPGLEPALWTGIVFAQNLAKKWNTPIVPVNHMEGHIVSPFGKEKGIFSIPKIKFPVLSLLVSGGHTELVLVEKWGKYKILGETLDDAAGEAFDKVARMMNLPYPGGPEISKLAEEIRKEKTLLPSQKIVNSKTKTREIHRQKKIHALQKRNISFTLPRPMLKSKNYNFSFSGLKTAVLYLIKKIGKLDEKIKKEIALEFENAVVETLVYKTKRAIEEFKVKTLIVAGGVASNNHLRKTFKKELDKNLNILLPTKSLATDNSIMIGMVGYLKYLNKVKLPNPKNIKAEGNLKL